MVSERRDRLDTTTALQELGVPTLAPRGVDVILSGSCSLWIDYFNEILKCFEPLLDPVNAVMILQQVQFPDVF